MEKTGALIPRAPRQPNRDPEHPGRLAATCRSKWTLMINKYADH